METRAIQAVLGSRSVEGDADLERFVGASLWGVLLGAPCLVTSDDLGVARVARVAALERAVPCSCYTTTGRIVRASVEPAENDVAARWTTAPIGEVPEGSEAWHRRRRARDRALLWALYRRVARGGRAVVTVFIDDSADDAEHLAYLCGCVEALGRRPMAGGRFSVNRLELQRPGAAGRSRVARSA